MNLLSGLQESGPSSAPLNLVSWMGDEFGLASTTKMSVLLLRSGSASWLLTKATFEPSGDQAASSSGWTLSVVSLSSFLLSVS